MRAQPAPRQLADEVPLAFTQQWTWDVLKLDSNFSWRSVAVALRLSGQLDVGCLRRSCAALVLRHESLRTTIKTVDGVPQQRIGDTRGCDLDIIDLTSLPDDARELRAAQLGEQLVHEPVDIAQGPLFAARLLKIGNEAHRLVVALDHMVSDGASVGILLRELWTLYGQALRAVPLGLPQLPLQFADYAVWLRRTHSAWLAEQGPYWRKRLSGAQSLQLFQTISSDPVRMATIPCRIGQATTARLREFGRRERSTLVMSVLTAYIALLLRWSERTDVVITFLSLGRFWSSVKNAIGYFDVPMFLRMGLSGADNFRDLLKQVTHEYWAAYAHPDFGYLAAETPKPVFAANPRFNWYPQEFDLSPSGSNEKAGQNDEPSLIKSPLEIAPRYDVDARGGGPELMIGDGKDEIAGRFWYRADLASLTEVERFMRNFHQFVEAMVTTPDVPVLSMWCRS